LQLESHDIRLPSRQSEFTLFAFGDMHIANKAFDLSHFKKLIQRIQDTPLSLWVGMGDFGDSIGPRDKRFEQENLRPLYRENISRIYQEEAWELKELLTPVADKSLGLVESNHAKKAKKDNSFDLTHELCTHFGWANLRSCALVRMHFLRSTTATYNLDLFVAHGYGGGRKWGGKMNKIADIASGIRADIYLMGHLHSCGVLKEIELSLPSSGELHLIQKERIGCLVPSFFRSYQEGVDTYASEQLYPPSAIGWTEIKVRLESAGGKDKLAVKTVI
jgi:hypothetical protein